MSKFAGDIIANNITQISTYLTDTGAADAYACSTSSPLTLGYTPGLRIAIMAASANTGASTLNVNGLGAVSIKKYVNQDLVLGDILANQIVEFVYDGTNFQITMMSTGQSGYSGFSGYSGSGVSGYSGYSGYSGFSDYSGYSGSGVSGYSGYSGYSGISGY